MQLWLALHSDLIITISFCLHSHYRIVCRSVQTSSTQCERKNNVYSPNCSYIATQLCFVTICYMYMLLLIAVANQLAMYIHSHPHAHDYSCTLNIAILLQLELAIQLAGQIQGNKYQLYGLKLWYCKIFYQVIIYRYVATFKGAGILSFNNSVFNDGAIYQTGYCMYAYRIIHNSHVKMYSYIVIICIMIWQMCSHEST